MYWNLVCVQCDDLGTIDHILVDTVAAHRTVFYATPTVTSLRGRRGWGRWWWWRCGYRRKLWWWCRWERRGGWRGRRRRWRARGAGRPSSSSGWSLRMSLDLCGVSG